MAAKKGKKRKKKGIDMREVTQWLILTMIYVIFVALIGGFIETSLDDLYWIGSIPFDIKEAIWIFAVAFWGMMTVWLGFKYQMN